LNKHLVFFLCASSAAAILAVSALANAASPPPKLPPGMTPAMAQEMMTLGPKHPQGIPANAVPVSGCIPTMGYHYAALKDFPFGPIYGWYKGKLLFTEVMISKTEFEKGTSWDSLLQPLPGNHIDHVDIWYERNGHPGYQIPHYDIHAWYVPHKEHMVYCDNPSGTKPFWMR
jgi:hypothetical protein